jgi:hypothetical protein
MQFIEWNIEQDYVSHWSRPASEIFSLLKTWLQNHEIPMSTILV